MVFKSKHGKELKMLSSNEIMMIVIDVQGKLASSINDPDYHLDKIIKLIKGMKLFDVPISLTVQAPDKIGQVIDPIKQLLPDHYEIPRTSFSVYREPEMLVQISKNNRKKIILSGYETHICIFQSAIDLINAGYEVIIVVDATSSREMQNKEIAILEMESRGAHLRTVEMLFFELIKDVNRPVFKEIHKLIK